MYMYMCICMHIIIPMDYVYLQTLLSCFNVYVTFAGKSHRHVSPKEGAAAGDNPKHASSPEAAVAPPIEERRRPGYCECCSVRYRDLTMVSGCSSAVIVSDGGRGAQGFPITVFYATILELPMSYKFASLVFSLLTSFVVFFPST